MDIAALLDKKRLLIEAALMRYLPEKKNRLSDAMRYSLLAGGKRLRPILALLSYEAAGGRSEDEIIPAACALEYVHTFTLIHDDLPAMDNDDFRRGKPTCHKEFGEGMAILAGDGLMIDGLGLVARSTASSDKVKRAIALFCRVLGSEGVTLGQADDLYGKEINSRFLRHIHLRKTALFIAFSILTGALLAGSADDMLARLEWAGVLAGMGFQVRDDILDRTSSLDELGKTPGKDTVENKLTYPHLYGVERSERIARSYAKRARRIFENLGENWRLFSYLTDFLVVRTK